ncbi:unnamed protein product [Schistocephalus solidus]|uniref:Secreted protein n=1 Tax=Schistocephalus solidus TaxID=70667 RepID=A0A183T1G3_SCHSO|nr:unnamed protein product [Schistocephalus solidus]
MLVLPYLLANWDNLPLYSSTNIKSRDHLCQMAVYSLDNGHAFAWDKTRIIAICLSEKGLFFEAMSSDESCVNLYTELDAIHKNRRENWKRTNQ